MATHWTRFLNRFNDDFLRIYKIGIYKEHPSPDLGLIKKYKVESLIVLAEHSIRALQDLLIASEKTDISQNFEAHHLPKLKRALANVQHYHNHNKAKEAYQNRVINFSDTLMVLGDSPYTWVRTVLNHEAFQEIQGIFEVIYWFQRYISHSCHGHVKIDENDEFVMLQKSLDSLKNIFDTKGYDWSYVRFCNTIIAGLAGIPQTPENIGHIEKAISLVMPLLPRSGSLKVEGPNQEKSTINLKDFLAQSKIKLPENLWNKGLNKKLPAFLSKQALDDSF